MRRLQILQDATDFALIGTGLDGRVQSWNEAARIVFGWTAEEIVGELAHRLFTAEDIEAGVPEREMASARDDGRAADQRWHIAKDGSRFWADGEMTLLKDDGGAGIGFVKILRDRTAQRVAEEKLARSEARFRDVAEAVPGFIWSAEADGALNYTSGRWQDYSGSTPEESRGVGWTAFLHPDDIARAARVWERSVETGEPYEIEFRLRRQDGVYRWWLARALHVDDRFAGATRWIGVCTDIDEIVAARETLARSRVELEALVEEAVRDRDRLWLLSDALVGVAARNGRFQDVNPAWTALLGWTPAEIRKMDYRRLVHPDDAEATAPNSRGWPRATGRPPSRTASAPGTEAGAGCPGRRFPKAIDSTRSRAT